MTRMHSLIALVCLVIFAPFAASAQEQESVALQISGSGADFGTAPAFHYMDEQGRGLTLDVGKHKLTALHFWATWCVPCVDELPQVDDAQDIFGPKLQVVAISLDGKNAAKAKKFLVDHKIKHLPVLLDPASATPKLAGLKGLPGTLFIDQKGRIVARADGPLDWQREDVVKFIKARLK